GGRHPARQPVIDSGAEADIRELFRGLGDMERVLSRIALRSARPRDLSTRRDGLAMLREVRSALAPLDSPRLQALAEGLGEHAAEAHLLATALVEQPPVLARDGGVFADGHDAELDELRALSANRSEERRVGKECRPRRSA